MKVELSIKDDKELRDLIKDMIRGAVPSIIRDELKEISRQQLSVALEKTYEVRQLLNRSGKVNAEVTAAIKGVVSDKVEEQIFDKALEMLQRDNATIDKLITDRLRGLSLRVGA
jgi:hypothetical protein